MAYHVLRDGEQQGPFEESTVADMIARGEVTAETLVWTAGMADWSRADSAPGLASLFAGAPPAPATRRAAGGGFGARPPTPGPGGGAAPLDISGAIATGLGAFGRQPWRAMVVALLYNILPMLLLLPLFGVAYALFGGEPDAPPGPAAAVAIALLVLAAIGLVVVLYGGFCGAMIDLVRDQQVDAARLFSGFRRAAPLIVFGILYALAVTVGFMLLVLPGIFAAVVFMLTPYIVMESELTGIAAMKASFRAVMTLGWWRCFALLLLVFVALFVSAALLEALGVALGNFLHGVLQLAVNIVVTAVVGAVFAAMYEQARHNSERGPA